MLKTYRLGRAHGVPWTVPAVCLLITVLQLSKPSVVHADGLAANLNVTVVLLPWPFSATNSQEIICPLMGHQPTRGLQAGAHY